MYVEIDIWWHLLVNLHEFGVSHHVTVKFNVAIEKEDKKCKVFFYFHTNKHLFSRIQ